MSYEIIGRIFDSFDRDLAAMARATAGLEAWLELHSG